MNDTLTQPKGTSPRPLVFCVGDGEGGSPIDEAALLWMCCVLLHCF